MPYEIEHSIIHCPTLGRPIRAERKRSMKLRALIAGTTIDVPRGFLKCPYTLLELPDTLRVCPEEIPVNCTIRSAVI